MLTRDPVEWTEQGHEDFVEKSDAALGETKTITGLFPLILGDDPTPHEQDVLFTNLDPLVPEIMDAKLFLFDGASAIKLKRHVRQSLDRLVVPSKKPDIPILPNFYIEAKGPDGVDSVVGPQILQDGTSGSAGNTRVEMLGSHINDISHFRSDTSHR